MTLKKGEHLISNTRQVDNSAGEGCGRGAGLSVLVLRQEIQGTSETRPPSQSPILPLYSTPHFNASSLIQVQCGVNAGFQEQTDTQTNNTGNSDCFVE